MSGADLYQAAVPGDGGDAMTNEEGRQAAGIKVRGRKHTGYEGG